MAQAMNGDRNAAAGYLELAKECRIEASK